MDLQERVSLKKADRNELYCLEPPFPSTNFLLELSNACNQACIFCCHQKMQRPVKKMDKAFAFDILQQAYDLGTREVGFYATGEPFLVNDLPDYIRKAKEIGYTYVYLTSNGSLATEEKIRQVIDAGLDSIKFSINAPEPKLYEFIHGRNHFDTVMKHLEYLNIYRKESGKQFKIYITGILTKYTENMKDKYFEVFGNYADQIVFKLVYNQGGYMPEVDLLLRCDCDKEEKRRCNLPFDAVSITAEGYLSIENADYENMLVVADLNKVSLKEGWYGDKMKDMRRRFIENDLEGILCDGCINHEIKDAFPLTPELATCQHFHYDDSIIRSRIESAGFALPNLVYVPMAADIIHPGHINILKKSAELGSVIVGLFTDEAIASYKRQPCMTYEQRKIVVENIKGVFRVIPQITKDYEQNIRMLKPAFMVHGTDWRNGPLAEVRAKAIRIMDEWGGKVVEPEYTTGVSSTMLKRKMAEQDKNS